MSAIKEIRLYNFKAFYKDNIIELDGKNLLLYGENGSGKSSIYWALYTLLQSSTKSEEDILKYFDASNDQNLINTHLIESQCYIDDSGNKIYPNSIGLNANVQIFLQDGTDFLIDSRGLVTTQPDKLKLLYRRSDFISHRLLINFYNFRNSKKINLWDVFVRDILPFITANEGTEEKSLIDEFREIEKGLPLSFKTEPDGTKRFSVLRQSDEIKKNFTAKISKFNDDLEYWIIQVNTYVNKFYEENFKNIGDKNIQISLQLEKRLEYIYGYKQKYIHNGDEYSRNCNFVGISNPEISLLVKIENADGSFSSIAKPQSYFNEAKITSIALAIRFTLLLEFIRPDDTDKFLVLDDMLVSLDMSNRDKVLDIILDVFAKDYKIYLFTHERSFFNMVKRRLVNRNHLEDWKIKEVFMNDFSNPSKPKIVENDDYLGVSLKHLKNFDLPACANYLRKECERLMKYLLPDNLSKKQTEGETEYHKLENMIESFLKYFSESLHIDVTNYKVLKEKKDLILNPMSHDNLDSEIYKEELVRFHNLLLELRQIKKTTVIRCDEQFFFMQQDTAGITGKYIIQTLENLHYYKLADGTMISKNIKCKFLKCEKTNQSEVLNHQCRFDDLQKVAYHHATNEDATIAFPNVLATFKNLKDETFTEIISNNS